MSSTQSSADVATEAPAAGKVEMKLEVVVVPVSDVDRAKAFYGSLGWREDADFATDELRVVQFTPPGSHCSINFGENVTTGVPGSLRDLQLTVSDIDAARAELVDRGVDVGEIFHDTGGVLHHAGTEGSMRLTSAGTPRPGSSRSCSSPRSARGCARFNR